ncbi:hypothetical protein [Streptomyces sp. NRRL B-24484]|uniref:hypothetical protein n=1 Tax=Streptomyces sp. NRRL B-24484 TaxID=1463833 RepID=UPI0004C1BA9D|nr:hypothetical protein [Streptomyces sp. NRRL B-24484]
MDVPVRLVVDLLRDRAVPGAVRLRARRRRTLLGGGSPVRVPGRLALRSRLELMEAASVGRLTVAPGGGALRFAFRGAAPGVEIPTGGRIVVATAAEPDRWASAVARTVLRYEAVPGRPVWIETTAADAPLVHRALTGGH